jgi:hypothetical protein
MNQKVLLIISLLFASSALSNATNNEQSLRVSKRESPLEQLFPLLRLQPLRLNRLQNGSIFMHEINSAINYANSTIQRVMEETRNLFNLSADQYNSDEIAVIMAFPMSNISLNSNESSILLNNSSSNENSSYGLNEVKDGLNFSGRFLDLNELFSFVPSPFNLMGHKKKTETTTPATYAQSYSAYPVVPVIPVVHIAAPVSYEVPEAPRVPYEVPEVPHVSYEVPEAPHVAYEEPKAPQYASVSAKAEVEHKPQAVPYN